MEKTSYNHNKLQEFLHRQSQVLSKISSKSLLMVRIPETSISFFTTSPTFTIGVPLLVTIRRMMASLVAIIWLGASYDSSAAYWFRCYNIEPCTFISAETQPISFVFQSTFFDFLTIHLLFFDTGIDLVLIKEF